MTRRGSPDAGEAPGMVSLGLRGNVGQFLLLLSVGALVGATVGQ